MPRYDYRCTPCDKSFEIARSINDREPVACPTCGAEATRIFSPVGVVFKGSGFHSTDYRSAKNSAPKASETDGNATTPSCGGGDSAACASCPASAE